MPEEKNNEGTGLSNLSIQEEKSLNVEEMLKKNLQWSQIIYEQNKKIKRRLNLMVWGGVVKWLIILAPIILGIIYLPALLKPYWDQYAGLLGIGGGAGIQSNQLDTVLKGISPTQIQDIMKSLGK